MVTPRKRRTTETTTKPIEPGEIVIVRMECPCGWCLTNDCAHCKAELLVDRKLYLCGCKKCCDGHKPSVGGLDDEIGSEDEQQPEV